MQLAKIFIPFLSGFKQRADRSKVKRKSQKCNTQKIQAKFQHRRKKSKTKSHKAENPIYSGRAETGRAETGRVSHQTFGYNLTKAIGGKANHWQGENKGQGNVN